GLARSANEERRHPSVIGVGHIPIRNGLVRLQRIDRRRNQPGRRGGVRMTAQHINTIDAEACSKLSAGRDEPRPRRWRQRRPRRVLPWQVASLVLIVATGYVASGFPGRRSARRGGGSRT